MTTDIYNGFVNELSVMKVLGSTFNSLELEDAALLSG